MWRLADECLDEIVPHGKCEFLSAYAKPFSLLVIADLLGVPHEDHEEFRTVLGAPRPGATVGSLEGELVATNPWRGWMTSSLRIWRTAARTRVMTS